MSLARRKLGKEGRVSGAVYTKHVYRQYSSIVHADVCRDGKQVCTEFWQSMLGTDKSFTRIFKKAHKWADGAIKTMQENEQL